MRHRICIPIISLIILAAAVPVLAGYYERGTGAYMYKKYDRAKEMFLKATEIGDNDGNAFYFLGEIEKLQGNYKEAEEYYQQAVKRKSITGKYLKNAYWNILLLAEQRGDIEAVIRCCKEMWQRLRDQSARQKIENLINKYLWTENAEAIERYQEGIELKKSGDRVKAQEQFRKAIAADGSFLAPKFELGMIAYKNGELDTAASYLDEIARRVSFYAEVHLVLGDIAYRRGNYERAAGHFTSVADFGIIDDETLNIILLKRGTCYYKMGVYDRAADDLEKAVARKGGLDTLLLLSAVRIKQEKYKEALKTLQRAQTLAPDNSGVLYQIGSVYYRLDDERYITYFDRLFTNEAASKSISPQYEKVFVVLAKAMLKQHKYERVKKIAGTLRDRNNSELILMSARARYHLSDFDGAVAEFERIQPAGDDRYLFCLASARSGRKDRARQLLRELMTAPETAARARRDPHLSDLVREIDRDGRSPSGDSGDNAR